MAKHSLSRNHFKPLGTQAIAILARLAAKKAIKEKLRADGVRLTLVPPRVIAEQAQRYLTDHADELYREAKEGAVRMGLIKPQLAETNS